MEREVSEAQEESARYLRLDGARGIGGSGESAGNGGSEEREVTEARRSARYQGLEGARDCDAIVV